VKTLRLFTDGAARGNPGPAGIGVVIEDDHGMRLQGRSGYIGTATNNQAEYRALIEGLRTAAAWKPDRLEVFLDSRLVVEQVNGRFKIKEKTLQDLCREAQEQLRTFPEVVVTHVEREKNRGADGLAHRGIDEWKAAQPQARKGGF
jgi:ribonuclease HI